ncbi:reverse transcriptase (RNA-dependent DNA polymerase) domain-containing protein [Hirsutella rhossiliensis]|uniref:Reverse transcriptase (RNA-dependent DNA polymerase) domain-containing protein n=1 Tax=Hirsutella rhossiliensis TaxID=111463 RepID=A0A9P8MYE8_9HYPO|nr:reverse transcriptase (RNA-dependent DNA polymerase) domain-containing protein [Hirsutella rhossiliensis]KAH0962576.1 reverse transcriptase (RNA-dependent DNA polymerase) domain-containing protein [Hirsutella rhossiliensis]
MAFITMDIDGRAERLYGYVIPGLEFDLILGKGWAERNDVVYKAGKRFLQIGRGNSRVKGWIRASSSPASAPVLFNDRYPLPLIRETLRNLATARWFTKLDVRAAFHRLRVRHGDEWKTAFRTRYGQFEWLVTPFGLTGAPATFQRYINSHLHDLLDEFCSAYMDDVIIYSDGDYLDHMTKVRTVMERLRNAGLKLDLEKCAFAAIRDWEAPTTVTGVRSFLGFANFYREFIETFAAVSEPLNNLTKKLTKWNWDASAQNAFNKLKELLITSPVLAMFHSDRETVLECDASGWAVGAVLSARRKGRLRPVGYFSRKFSAAEVNYDIHDKELLAIVAAMEHFSGELRSVDKFIVVSDHKNLQYFMTNRRLSERQVRLAETLSRYTFKIVFRAGKDNTQPDFLSRRAQDLPANGDDERLKNREFQLLKDHWLPPRTVKHHQGDYILNQLVSALLWDRGLIEDGEYRNIHASVVQGNATFPSEYNLSVQVPDCEIDDRGALLRRGALWTHDSHITGHPGRDVTLNILQRSYFWPQQYLMCHYRFHGFPKTMTSDRGSNWVSKFWQRLCELVRIEQRLSTAYHPQTDGATERMNQEVLVYLRIFVAYAQTDWAGLLPMAMLAINNRDSSVTGYSPFFLTHGYHAEPIQQNQISSRSKTDPKARADHFIARLREGQELAQAAKATAQQIMEHQANKGRRPSQKFVVGERVWLNLKNVTTPTQKKLSWTQAQYKVTRVIAPDVYELDVPSNIHPRFFADLLRKDPNDPLPSQVQDDTQPPPLLDERHPKGRELLVKWDGYIEPTWEPRDNIKLTDAFKRVYE